MICGHIHHAALHERFGIRYANAGDWVESCTALAERDDGTLEIIRWAHECAAGLPPVSVPPARAA